jgi:N-carbamoylputrescine amidase
MKDLRVAVVCMQSYFGQIEQNMARIESYSRGAASNKVHMICFPELSITGYNIKEDPRQFSQPIPGPLTDRVLAIAQQYKLVVITGMLEKAEGDGIYISQFVAGPQGLIGVHRKTHLSPQEKKIYSSGQEVKTFTHDHCRFGIQLCYEAHFPELTTIMSLQGAEIVFFAHASPRGRPEEKRESWFRHLPARAFDNGIFVVACNQVGENGTGLSFPGVIMVFDPVGKPLCEYAGRTERMITAELRQEDLKKVRRHRMRYFFQFRRPELYGAICRSLRHKTLDMP